MKCLVVVVLLAAGATQGSALPSCNVYTDCDSCASSSNWGLSCRWCPKESMCHSAGSQYDTCSSSEIITDPSKCGTAPAPTPPAPAPSASTFALEAVTSLFKHFNISVDPSTCVSDVGRADIQMRDFAEDAKGGNYSMALTSLSRSLYALSSAVAPCGVPQLQNKIDMLAAAVHWADVTTYVGKALVGARDLWSDMAAVGRAVAAEDPTAAGTGIGKLMTDWSTIVGGCNGNTACTFLDGFLKLVQAVALDAEPCEQALVEPLKELSKASELFNAASYEDAVKQFAAALDGIAKAIGSDSCGLKSIADVISQVSPKLSKAVVKIDSSRFVTIIVGSADVFDTLYSATVDIQAGNAAGFGEQMGALLNQLKTAGCETQACTILQGLLAAVQLEARDFTACAADLDTAWESIPTAVRQFETRSVEGITQGLQSVGTFMTQASEAVGNCGITDLGDILANTASKLGANSTVNLIDEVVQALVAGSDVTNDINKVLLDVQSNQWLSLGHDLGSLSTWLSSVQCTSFVCKMTEGILQAIEIPFQNLTGCEADLRNAEASFIAGGYSMVKLNLKGALSYYSSGLQAISTSVYDCGMAKELIFLEQEANTLGLGNVTALGEAAQVLIHGADIYPELSDAHTAYKSGDYRTVGKELGKVMQTLAQWTEDYSCTDPFCFVVSGVMQYVGGAEGDIKACGQDFLHAFSNFTHGFHMMRAAGDFDLGDFKFNTNVNEIIDGVHSFGLGMKDMAQGVGQCHLGELAVILAKLGTKMTLAPEVGWLEELLHILIESKHIEQEIGDACLAWSSHNYPSFGFNLAKLIKTLV